MKRGRVFIEVLVLIVIMLLVTQVVQSQTTEDEFQTRSEIKLSYKPIDNIKIYVTPELRFDETFAADKFLLETGLAYKPIKFLELGGSYRYIVNYRDVKSTEYLHRFALDATLGKSFNRWKPSLRIRYTNYTEDNSNSNYLRYKAKLEYNIKNCKLSPLIAAEAFNDLEDGTYYKMRYTLGADYKLNKKNAISIAYKLDYYLQDYLNKHILYVGYKYKF